MPCNPEVEPLGGRPSPQAKSRALARDLLVNAPHQPVKEIAHAL